MGLIFNLIISIIHLAFVAMDILMLMMLVKVIYTKWGFEWLRHISDAIEPVMTYMLSYFQKTAFTIAGKTYSEKKLITLILIVSMILRLVIVSVITR